LPSCGAGGVLLPFGWLRLFLRGAAGFGVGFLRFPGVGSGCVLCLGVPRRTSESRREQGTVPSWIRWRCLSSSRGIAKQSKAKQVGWAGGRGAAKNTTRSCGELLKHRIPKDNVGYLNHRLLVMASIQRRSLPNCHPPLPTSKSRYFQVMTL